MATPSNAVDEAAELLRNRISELEDELTKLKRALTNLTGRAGGRRGPGRPRGSTSSSRSSSGRRRRRRSGGTRADQAVKHVTESPGITASQIAERMKIKPNYLYRVLSDLQAEGKVRKDGRAYHPTAAGSRAANSGSSGGGSSSGSASSSSSSAS